MFFFCFGFVFADTLYFGELNDKIRLLYCLHIPPGLSLCAHSDTLFSVTQGGNLLTPLHLFVSAALTESEDEPSVMKSPLLSTTRPLCVNLPPRQSKHTHSSAAVL